MGPVVTPACCALPQLLIPRPIHLSSAQPLLAKRRAKSEGGNGKPWRNGVEHPFVEAPWEKLIIFPVVIDSR